MSGGLSENVPDFPLIIYGTVHDRNGHSLGGVTVVLTNTNTNETKQNETPVTSTDGYQFDLSHYEQGWEPGHVLRIESRYRDGGHNYSDGYTFPIPWDINATNPTMNRPLYLTTCEDCTGGDGNGGTPTQQPHYYIHGVVTKQDGGPAENAKVIVKNVRTANSTNCTTAVNGTYSIDLIDLPSGWTYGDNIEINAIYGLEETRQQGYYIFKILHTLKNERVVNINLYQTFDQQPIDDNNTSQGKTMQEWIDAYWDLQQHYNETVHIIEALQNNITALQNEMNNTDTNYTQEEWDQLRWEVQRVQRTNEDNNRILIALFCICVLCIVYILWRNGLIPLPILGKYGAGDRSHE